MQRDVSRQQYKQANKLLNLSPTGLGPLTKPRYNLSFVKETEGCACRTRNAIRWFVNRMHGDKGSGDRISVSSSEHRDPTRGLLISHARVPLLSTSNQGMHKWDSTPTRRMATTAIAPTTPATQHNNSSVVGRYNHLPLRSLRTRSPTSSLI